MLRVVVVCCVLLCVVVSCLLCCVVYLVDVCVLFVIVVSCRLCVGGCLVRVEGCSLVGVRRYLLRVVCRVVVVVR